jgi:2,3-bisphosphoglycerate-independent phosphoglycerate mutase
MIEKSKILPLIFVVLDGWGLTSPSRGNAIELAKTPTIDGVIKKYPHTSLFAHGKHVGLPEDQDGNSESGHMTIGAGRIIEQDSVKIIKSIESGDFFRNPALLEAVRHSKNYNSNFHIMGMLSNGMSAHSNPKHISALIKLAKDSGLEKIYLHLFTDGRDSPKYIAGKLVDEINKICTQEICIGRDRIATIMGRFYAMDRRKKWNRTVKAYEALVLGKGKYAESARDAITKNYNSGGNDEFMEPYVVAKNKKEAITIKDNDSVVFFNLRSDRARQLAKIFVQKDFNKSNPDAPKREKTLKNLTFTAMTDFGPDLDLIITAYPSEYLKNTLPVMLKDYSQLYIAESEKYAHVTYFFNGGYAKKMNGEDYFMIESPNVKSYDQTPEMKSRELADRVIKNLDKNKYEVTILNFAAPDMIGHTGNLQAGIDACEIIDSCLKKIIKAYLKKKGTVVISADHGNIEEMINLETGEIDTEHSSFKVPFAVVNNYLKNKIELRKCASLKDIAPTILSLLNVKKPKEMTGSGIIKFKK